MISIDFSIDLHCHPTYKPGGKSFSNKTKKQSDDPDDKTSLWHYDPPSLSDKLLNEIVGLTKFSQANFTASAKGGVWVMVVALSSIEKWFFNNKQGTGLIADVMENFATEVGRARINAIQEMEDYFKDLLNEFSFVSQGSDKPVNIEGNDYSYTIVHNFAELNAIAEHNEAELNADKEKKNIRIAIIVSIEGLHALNCGLHPDRRPDNIKADAATVLANVKTIKNHEHKPWFVTFTHHFYNELCGHAESLKGLIAKKCDQKLGINTGFTQLGLDVLDLLLDNTDGKRILIDSKHLSPLARKQLSELRKSKYPDIPVIISHGVCNGLPSTGVLHSQYPALGSTFNEKDINFFDDEIIEMVKSNGIMGLQLDERRIANDESIKRTKHSFFKNKIMHFRSELVWKQVQYIAELLDANGLFAWGNIAIGSDYDGIIDPLNSFWTMEQFPDLKSYLERHAFNYLTGGDNKLKNNFNKISADVVVQNIFQINAWKFFERWY